MNTYRRIMLFLFLPWILIGCGESHSTGDHAPSLSIESHGTSHGKGTKRGTFTERLPRVEVVIPHMRSAVVRTLDVSATVDALKKVDLSARVPGEVRDLADYMDIGRVVKAGDILLRLHVPELIAERNSKEAIYNQAVQQLKVSEKNLLVSQREIEESEADQKKFDADELFNRQRYSRIRELVRQRAQEAAVEQEAYRQWESSAAAKTSNKVRIDKRKARKEAAVEDIELARQKIKTAKADVEKLEAQIEFATIRAPFNGVITRRWIDPGALIKDGGSRLLTIMQIDKVRVLIDVPQRDVPNLNDTELNPNKDSKLGDAVTIRIPALPSTMKGAGLQGNIRRIGGSLDPVTRTMRAEIELDNPEYKLRPGMYGSATVVVDRHPNAMTVPGSAVVRRGEGEVELYIVTEVSGEGNERRGILRRVPVTLGIDEGKEVEILEVQFPGEASPRKLRGDELIVARATGIMRDGETVLAIGEREKK